MGRVTRTWRKGGGPVEEESGNRGVFDFAVRNGVAGLLNPPPLK